MENVLNEIHGKFIKMPEEEVRRNKQILESVIATFTEKMKSKDQLFEKLFRRVFYGGSFYDGLRVSKPEEFDLDLLLDIPKYAKPELMNSDISGFVHLQLNEYDAWMRQPGSLPGYTKFHKLFDHDMFLSTDKVLRWMESIIDRSLRDLPFENGVRILRNEMGTFEIKPSKSGPASTLCIRGAGLKMDVDLVACFVFPNDKWLFNFRSNPFPSSKPEFFIVPKSPKGCAGTFPSERYWRLSFQEQERELLKGKERLKPAVRLLKKLRDNMQHNCISSYYIKTVILHLVDQKDHTFCNKPLNHVFMTALREYKGFIQNEDIPYYWNADNNLIGNVNKATLQNINGRLGAIIRNVERNPDNPKLIAKYLLSEEEYEIYMNQGNTTVNEQDENNQKDQSKCTIL